MFKSNRFSICDYDSICEMLNVIPDGETKRMLRPLHCVEYSDMSKPLRKWLFDTVLSVAQLDGFNLKKSKGSPIEFSIHRRGNNCRRT